MFVIGGNGTTSPGFTGDFVESLVADAAFAYARMRRCPLSIGRNARNQAEWRVYTRVLARFLGVDTDELRDKLIEERSRSRDLRLCSDRLFAWAYHKRRF